MALPDYFGLLNGTTRDSGISAVEIQNNANYLGSAIDNSYNLDDLMDLEIVWSYASTPTANNLLKVYRLYAQNGTNYEEGAGDGTGTGDVDPLANCLLCAVTPPADASTHRKAFGDFPLLPYKCKLLVMNSATGQTATVTLNVKTRKAGKVTD